MNHVVDAVLVAKPAPRTLQDTHNQPSLSFSIRHMYLNIPKSKNETCVHFVLHALRTFEVLRYIESKNGLQSSLHYLSRHEHRKPLPKTKMRTFYDRQPLLLLWARTSPPSPLPPLTATAENFPPVRTDLCQNAENFSARRTKCSFNLHAINLDIVATRPPTTDYNTSKKTRSELSAACCCCPCGVCLSSVQQAVNSTRVQVV